MTISRCTNINFLFKLQWSRSHFLTSRCCRSSINGCAFCTQVLLDPMESYLLRDSAGLHAQAGRIEPFPTSSFVKLQFLPSTGGYHFKFFIGSGDSWSGYLARAVQVSSSNISDILARSSNVSIIPEDVQKYVLDNITGPKMKSDTMDGLSLARQWYRTCCDSHGNQCHDRQSLGTRPTRLLDLAESPPRLCLGQELDRDSKYAALSTCPRPLISDILLCRSHLVCKSCICFLRLSRQFSLL